MVEHYRKEMGTYEKRLEAKAVNMMASAFNLEWRGRRKHHFGRTLQETKEELLDNRKQSTRRKVKHLRQKDEVNMMLQMRLKSQLQLRRCRKQCFGCTSEQRRLLDNQTTLTSLAMENWGEYDEFWQER